MVITMIKEEIIRLTMLMKICIIYDPNWKNIIIQADIVIKLWMNSVYGKTIIKPIETDTIVKNNKEAFGKYTSYKYNYIGWVIEVNGTYYIKTAKSILSHYNYVHCGVETLSMSKRIMNKVFSCANDCDVKIYYQDTDSIHFNYDDVPWVVKRYKEKYGLDLVGEDLGNFHVDFPDIEKRCGEVYAIESFFLSKRSYFDHLESMSKEGEQINGDLSRMKGIPTSCIEYYAKIHNISVLEIYSQLCDGKSIEYGLANDNNKCVFRNNKDHTISSLYEGQKGITRTCKFVRNENDKIVTNWC